MRRKIIAGNWKMNLLPFESEGFLRSLRALIDDNKCEVVVCPPFTHLERAWISLSGSSISLGAQNVAWEQKGAYTGEISAPMLKELGVEFAIVGHSERRAMFGETDAFVNKRAKAAISCGITPIICVGETLQERENGQTQQVIVEQIANSTKELEPADYVIAYEPVWAIGTGKVPTMQEIEQAIECIRCQIKGGEDVCVLYGGSLNAKNAAQILALEQVDGGLIGGASLVATDFLSIIQAMDANIAKN